MIDILTVGPSAEGKSMDKLRDLANGERRHISITDARAIVSLFEDMRVKVGSLTMQLDMQYGTPCAQIRWQQERERLLELIDAACSNAEVAHAFLRKAGRPGLADSLACHPQSIRAEIERMKA